MIEFLRWMLEQGKVSVWPFEWSVMHKKARTQGFIEEAGSEPGRRIPFTMYQLSEKGRYIIEQA